MAILPSFNNNRKKSSIVPATNIMSFCDQLLQLLSSIIILQRFVQIFVELATFDKHDNYCSSGELRAMAPPHTMMSKTPSPTTLIPGLEAMHITSHQLVKSLADELEEAAKNKMDGDKSDTESIASRESKEYDAYAESDGATSFDESNESMEFISPSKVIGTKEKQDHAIQVEGPDGLKTPDRTSTRKSPLNLLLLLDLLTSPS
jgi:hypothetical protein